MTEHKAKMLSASELSAIWMTAANGFGHDDGEVREEAYRQDIGALLGHIEVLESIPTPGEAMLREVLADEMDRHVYGEPCGKSHRVRGAVSADVTVELPVSVALAAMSRVSRMPVVDDERIDLAVTAFVAAKRGIDASWPRKAITAALTAALSTPK